MAKIIIVDFTPADKDRLASEKYDVDLQSTGWKAGPEATLDLAGRSEERR